MAKILITALLVVSVKAFSSPWIENESPKWFENYMNTTFETNFSRLPLKGVIRDKRLNWSGTYWPFIFGGISYRWNDEPYSAPFTYRSPSKAEVFRMSREQLEKLSPTEKYDLSQGDYSYSMTKKIMSRSSPTRAWWEGICHGWVQAAINYDEPNRVDIRNKDGLVIPFGSSDVKALLSYYNSETPQKFGRTQYWNKATATDYARMGQVCEIPGKVPGEENPEDEFRHNPDGSLTYVGIPVISEKDKNREECNGINAGAFHITIANMLGIIGKPFAIEIDRYKDLWNQPANRYEAQVVNQYSPNSYERSQGIAQLVHLKVMFEYGEELGVYRDYVKVPEGYNSPYESDEPEEEEGKVSMFPVTGTKYQNFRHKDYEYVLELDRYGRIIGGRWISETRPDILWLRRFRENKFGSKNALDFSGLNVIYQPLRQ